jgi:hypothetical protein
MVYVGTGSCSTARPDTAEVVGLGAEDLGLKRKVTIHGMQCVTALASHPRTGLLWVVGLRFSDRPLMPSAMQPAFYQACLAVIQPAVEEVEAMPLSGTDSTADSDVAVPTSVVWTGF